MTATPELASFERDDLHREIVRTQGNWLEQTQAYDKAGRLLEQTLSHLDKPLPTSTAANTATTRSATMVGTLAEQAGVAVSKAPTHPLVARAMRATPREQWVAKGERLARGGRWIGFAGATVAVGWDAYHAGDEYMKGNRLVAVLYMTSSASGLAAAALPVAANIFPLIFGGVPVWPALVILFGVNVGLAMLDDPATLKWVQKCRFAKRPDPDKYHSMEAEWKEFVQLGIEVKDEGVK